MLEMYLKEFIGIGSHLQKNEENVHGEALLIEKVRLMALMNRNRFDTAENKLKIWKKLGWINTDKDRRLTKRVYNGQEHRYERCISINLIVLQTMLELTKQ